MGRRAMSVPRSGIMLMGREYSTEEPYRQFWGRCNNHNGLTGDFVPDGRCHILKGQLHLGRPEKTF